MSTQATHSSDEIHSDQIPGIPPQTKSFHSRKRRISLNDVLMNTGNNSDSDSDSDNDIPLHRLRKRQSRFNIQKPIISTLPRKSKPVHSSPEREYINLEESSESSEEVDSEGEGQDGEAPALRKYSKERMEQLLEERVSDAEKYGEPFEDRFSRKRIFAQTSIILNRVRLLNALKRMEDITLNVKTEVEFVEDESNIPMVQLDSVPRRTIHGTAAAPRSSYATLEAPTRNTSVPTVTRPTSSASRGTGSNYAAPRPKRAPLGLTLKPAKTGPRGPAPVINYLGHDIPVCTAAQEDGECQFCGAPDHSRDHCGLAEMEHPQLNESSQSFRNSRMGDLWERQGV